MDVVNSQVCKSGSLLLFESHSKKKSNDSVQGNSLPSIMYERWVIAAYKHGQNAGWFYMTVVLASAISEQFYLGSSLHHTSCGLHLTAV